MMSDKNPNEILIAPQPNDANHEMESLRHRVDALINEKDSMEADFGCRRAKFKEIMLKKEEEMRMDKEQASRRIQELQDQLTLLQKELDENKSLLMVSQLQKENEIDYYKQKHNEEIGLLRLNLNEKLESIKSRYDQEVEQLKKTTSEKSSSSCGENDSVFSSKGQQSGRNESMLSVVTKSFRQKVGSLNTSGLLNSSLDDKQPTKSIRDQEEGFDFLVPLEEEIKMLKEKLRNTDKKLNSYEKILTILMNEFGIERICDLINACSKPDETCETVNKFREEFINKKNLDASIQLADKDSILANLLCEQAKLRSENEKLLKRINQLVNSATADSARRTKQSVVVPAFSSFVSKLRRSQSSTNLSRPGQHDPEQQQQPHSNPDWRPANEAHNAVKFANETVKQLNKPCEMCSNYELQLQTLQISESDFMKKIEDYDKLLNASKQELIKEQEFRLQMEEQFIQQAKDCEQTIDKLQTKLATANHEISELKNEFNDNRKCLTEKLDELKRLNAKLNNSLVNAQNENARLLGRFVVRSKQLQREPIDLPEKLEDLQFYCLRIREDLISVSIAKEKLEEDFKSQMMLLKEQQKSDYLSERRIEESLTSENEKLKAQLTSTLKELASLKSVHDEHELLLRQMSSSMQVYEKTINELQILNNELMTAKAQFEQDNTTLKSKVQQLQSDLATSEAVQKDFVTLSQSLQIEMEKIRQADFEVRWQHEDDVTNCGSCKRLLPNKKDKFHCAHCGKIYCSNCNSKVIMGGPLKNRRFKVCHVCHTLLDQTTAPYFSTLPQNPT